QIVYFFSCESISAGNSYSNYQFCIIENTEILVLRNFVQFPEFHPETDVWLVVSETLHRFVVSHSWKFCNFNSVDFFQQMFGQTFKGIQNIFLFHKRHFAVNLCEFRLTVCTQILIAEAFHYLEIFVHSAHHQQLLESLRTLRKRIKLPFVHSTWNNEIARAL